MAGLVADGDYSDVEVQCTTAGLRSLQLDTQIYATTIPVFCDAMFFGAFLLSFLVGLFTISQRQQGRTRTTRFMLAAMALLFVLATLTTAVSLTRRSKAFAAQVNPALCQPSEGIEPPSNLLIGVRVASGHLMMWIGDAIILWRSWSITLDSRVIRALTLIIQLTAFDILVIRIPVMTMSPFAASIMQVVFLSFLLATNLLATFALVKKTRQSSRYNAVSSLSLCVLEILVECGVLYAVVQLIIVFFAIVEVIVPRLAGSGPMRQGTWQSTVLVVSSTVMVCGELVSGTLSCLMLGLVAIKTGGHSPEIAGEAISAIVFKSSSMDSESDSITTIEP
ncbi:hypothetical protein DL96DRAFT_1709950 [Flagelloscypha sp. PMI_526]|nr:hypothetical protein DL96DRAFT_1709950 [Flagelloscypha sp. PMI_526]